jgi:hypothetical protein
MKSNLRTLEMAKNSSVDGGSIQLTNNGEIVDYVSGGLLIS